MPCSICLETFTKTNVIELDCGHVLHFKCFKKLIRRRIRKCPLCRYIIIPLKLFNNNNNNNN